MGGKWKTFSIYEIAKYFPSHSLSLAKCEMPRIALDVNKLNEINQIEMIFGSGIRKSIIIELTIVRWSHSRFGSALTGAASERDSARSVLVHYLLIKNISFFLPPSNSSPSFRSVWR